MLKNAYFLAKIGADTAENERNFAKNWQLPYGSSAVGQLPIFGKISAKCCSFSAVSAPIFARKYAFDSIFQNLPDSQAEIFKICQNFANFATFAKFLLNFHKKC